MFQVTGNSPVSHPCIKAMVAKKDLNNYRPISVISHIPKIIERFVGNSLDKYFSDNSLICFTNLINLLT